MPGSAPKSANWLVLIILVGVMLATWSAPAQAYTANKVWVERRPTGIYRVHVNYTVPALKEFRESYVEFTSRKAADAYFVDLIRGADFYPPDPKKRRFLNQPLEPAPW